MLPHRLQNTNKTGSGPRGIDAPGTLWIWGQNDDGQLGTNDTLSRSSPVQVGVDNVWAQISGSNTGNGFFAAIKIDGTLWMWGNNNGGRIGQNDTVYRSSPTQVGRHSTWASVVAGNGHTFALKTDGTLWAWGLSSYGRLGLNTTANVSSPAQVGTLTNWAHIVPGFQHALAIKTDGTLWVWGRNDSGQLGLNDTTHRSSPTQVGSLTTWSTLPLSGVGQHSVVLKTDGTLWTWGNNVNGRLGSNSTTYRSSPAQVGTLTNWALLAGGSYHMLAIKTDGTLWTWGLNSSGELGLNTIADVSSPAQVGALTNWSSISGCGASPLALKTDGTLWAWGLNSYGQLGQGNVVNRSSPVQVGTLKTWGSVSVGRRHNSAIQLPDNNTELATRLLLHCDGADGSTTFVDSSRWPHVVTANGNAQVDTAQSKFGGASLLLDGTGDYLSIPDNDAWNFSSGDFTIDMWFRSASFASPQMVWNQWVDSSNHIRVYIESSTSLAIDCVVAGATVLSAKANPGTMSINTWYHWAVVRNGNNFHHFLNGVEASGSPDVDADALPDLGGTAYIGQQPSGFYFNGHLDEYRIVKGKAVWTSDFTPPTTPYS